MYLSQGTGAFFLLVQRKEGPCYLQPQTATCSYLQLLAALPGGQAGHSPIRAQQTRAMWHEKGTRTPDATGAAGGSGTAVAARPRASGAAALPRAPPGQPFDPLSSAPSPPGATLPASSIAE